MFATETAALPATFAADRRRGHRFRLRLRCRLSSPSRRFGELAGFTVNMSKSGMLVTLEGVESAGGLLTPGETVRVELDLPHSTSISPRCLECMATVARVAGVEEERLSLGLEIRRTWVRDTRP